MMAKMVEVDISKIDAVLKSTGIRQKDMGEALGHETTFISGVRSRGTMAMNDLMLFKSVYGVDISKTADEPHKEDSALDYGRLGAMMRGIIDYDKLANVMKDVIDYDRLSDAIYKAMVHALEGDKPKVPDSPLHEKRKLE